MHGEADPHRRSGDCLRVLHGFPYDVPAYDGVATRLAQRCRVLVLAFLDETERRLAARPPIAVSTVILEGADDGVTPPSAGPPADFPALRGVQVVPGVGYNLPQESPEAFATAILSLI